MEINAITMTTIAPINLLLLSASRATAELGVNCRLLSSELLERCGVVVPIINHSSTSTSAPATPHACNGYRRLSRDEPAVAPPSANAIPGPDTGGAVIAMLVVVVVVRAGVLSVVLDLCAPLPFEDVALDPPPL